MKKIYLMLIAAVMATVIPLHTMAETPLLTAKNDNGEVKVSITNSTVTKKADELLPDITECTEAVTNSITLKADAGVVASLRLVVSEIPTGDKTPLNNYDIVIKNGNEEVVYDSKSATLSKRNDSYKDMELGELKSGEEKTYSVTYKITDKTIDVSTVSVELVAKTNVVPTPTPASTLKPKYDFDSLENKSEFIFDFSEEFKDEAVSSTGSASEIKKICGQDIPAGRFSVTGNGNLKISSATGALKSESVVSETPVAGESVKTAVVLLEEGDVLTITSLKDGEKARLKFNKVTTAATTATATPVQPTAAAKTNPKTGDGGVGIVISVAALAVLAVGLLELLKRKSKTN